MRKSFWSGTLVRLSVLLFLPCLSVSAQANQSGWTPELAMRTSRVSSVRVSPDGKRVAFVVGQAVMEGEKSEWLSHIYLALTDGSQSLQLTRGDKSATSPEWSPDGRWIGFLAARDSKPDAKPNLWRIRVEGGEAEQLTDEKGGITAFQWSPDGSQIAFSMPEPENEDEEKAKKEKRDWRVVDENLKMYHLYVVPAEKDGTGNRGVRKLNIGNLSVNPSQFDWSPDAKWLVFSHQPTPLVDDWTKADVSVAEVASGKLRSLAATPAAERDPRFSPDGRWLAYVASDMPATWAGAGRVQVVSAGGGTPRSLAASYDEKPSILGWSVDGQRVLISETHRTVSRDFRAACRRIGATRPEPCRVDGRYSFVELFSNTLGIHLADAGEAGRGVCQCGRSLQSDSGKPRSVAGGGEGGKNRSRPVEIYRWQDH